jgi:hypothetical protein
MRLAFSFVMRKQTSSDCRLLSWLPSIKHFNGVSCSFLFSFFILGQLLRQSIEFPNKSSFSAPPAFDHHGEESLHGEE